MDLSKLDDNLGDYLGLHMEPDSTSNTGSGDKDVASTEVIDLTKSDKSDSNLFCDSKKPNHLCHH